MGQFGDGLRMIWRRPKVGIHHLLSAGLVATALGLDGDKNSVDLFHHFGIVEFEDLAPVDRILHVEDSHFDRAPFV